MIRRLCWMTWMDRMTAFGRDEQDGLDEWMKKLKRAIEQKSY